MSLRSFKLNAGARAKFLVFTFLFQTSFSVVGQDCDAKEFATIPGIWKGPGKGSIENVSQADLVKEREVLANIHEMMKKSYSPIGGDVLFSNIFGYNKYSGKNWLADPYEYSIYFFDYICKRDFPNSHNYEPNAETGQTVYFSINEIWSQNGYFKLYATELPDDHYDGYLSFTKWPEQKNGYLFWPLLEPEERYPQKEYQYLITYDGKLPFIPFTKGEYLALKIPLLQKDYEARMESLKSIDTSDSYGKRTFDEVKEFVMEKEKLVNETIELQKTLSAEELAQPAIIDAGESKSEFKGFKSETDSYINHLVKPNPNYFDPKLPKWVPQFISITIHTDIKEETGYRNIQNIDKAIDFAFLKSMLGKTNSNYTANPAIKTTQPEAKSTTSELTSPQVPSPVKKATTSETIVKPEQTSIKEDITIGNSPQFVYDLDSNRYEVIKIGNQYWFKENLRTTQYSDTTRITTGFDATQWKEVKSGAYAVYDDNSINKSKFGLLYNGYAAASGKLCPLGWHVATDKDWMELEKFLGLPEAELERTGERGEIAPKLKVPQGWKASSFSGDNSSGFGILPAGSRLDNGEYTTLGQYGNFWTSTVYDDRYGLLYLWNHHAHFNTNAVGRIYTIATNGYSCRCVKDPEKPEPKLARQ